MHGRQEDRERAKALLDNEYDWPSDFLFKFIIPQDKEEELRRIFPVADVKIRSSSRGRYISVTVALRMENSDEVLAVYAQASKIEGIISL